MTYPEFFWVDWYTHRTHEGATFWQQVEKFSNSVPPDTLKMHSLALSVLRFLCKTFSLLLMLTLRKTLVDDCKKNSYIQIKNLYSYKTVIAAEQSELKRCSVNYLHNRKSEYLRDL